MTLLYAFAEKLMNIIHYLIGLYIQFFKWWKSFYLNPPVELNYAIIMVFIFSFFYFAIDYYKKKFKH